MLFNSYAFIFGFLPIALIGCQIASRLDRPLVVPWLGLLSLAFYAYWRPAFVLLLLGSITINYFSARLIRDAANERRSFAYMLVAITLNILVLGYFKYFFPVLNFFHHALGSDMHWADVVLPLGISFFTFTQIAYLVDLQQGTARLQGPFNYILFVTFFPHLIAGPILHHQEMMPQFEKQAGLRWNDLAVGGSWFILGLAKKVLIADHLSVPVNTIYDLPGPLPALLAWRATLGYALQLYFDFSGYSDMALGLARMFSIDFPLNFSSPYKASNIIDFWQRWHMTLTRYITAYVYTPLQRWISARRQAKGKKVSRKALATPEGFLSMTAFPMLFTMGVAGVWHGAGLQYVVFGLLHGVYLTVNHGWRVIRHSRMGNTTVSARSPVSEAAVRIACVLGTFVCVLIAQVFFRAGSCSQALSVLAGMSGMHGLGLRTGLPGESHAVVARQLMKIVAGFAIVWFFPNTQQLLSNFKPSLERNAWSPPAAATPLPWRPSAFWALTLSALLFVALVGMQEPTTFLYFQF